MSIAVTAVVRPSPCLRLLQAGFAVCGLAAALAAGQAGLPPFLAISCVVASLIALWRLPRGATAHRFDISGIGQIRLAVYLLSADCSPPVTPLPVALLPGSTCWPWLLVLRLRPCEAPGVAGRAGPALPPVLIVLPDSVPPGVFRPLAVACRACAAKKP